MTKYVTWVGLLVLILAGMVFSYREWREWKYEETKNFGQGPGSLYLAAEEMSEKVDYAGFDLRVRYPSGWKVEADSKFVSLDARLAKKPNSKWSEVIGRNSPIQSLVVWTDSQKYSEPIKFVVELGTTDLSASDYVSKEVVRMKNEKLLFEGDREYRNNDFFQWTVLTYGTDKRMYKRAYAVSGEKLIVVTVDFTRGSEYQFLRTFEEFLREMKFISA